MTAAKPPLVSIVTPFFNTAAYLDECIQSVLAQTYQHWEYLLVNNRSNDGSLEIAEKYALGDPRIRVITQKEFLSQAENYNTALGFISNESTYTKIVQADDFLFPGCISAMVALSEANSPVGIVSSYYLDGTDIRNVGLPLESTVVSGEEACRRHLLLGQFLFGTPTSLMVRSRIIRERVPFFDLSSTMDDTEACYQLLREWDFGFIHQVLTFSRVHGDSITSRLSSLNPHLLDLLILTAKYGPHYLTNDEQSALWSRVQNQYLTYMAKSALRLREKSFWQYHRKHLRRIGYRLTPYKLFPYTLSVLFDLMLQPKLLIKLVRLKLIGRVPEVTFAPKRMVLDRKVSSNRSSESIRLQCVDSKSSAT